MCNILGKRMYCPYIFCRYRTVEIDMHTQIHINAYIHYTDCYVLHSINNGDILQWPCKRKYFVAYFNDHISINSRAVHLSHKRIVSSFFNCNKPYSATPLKKKSLVLPCLQRTVPVAQGGLAAFWMSSF